MRAGWPLKGLCCVLVHVLGLLLVCVMVSLDIKNGVHGNHVYTHVVGLLEDLRADAD
jgi:hypothetical protein